MLYQTQKNYAEALVVWVQGLALDQRLSHPARVGLQQKVDALVSEQHLQEAYRRLCMQHGIG